MITSSQKNVYGDPAWRQICAKRDQLQYRRATPGFRPGAGKIAKVLMIPKI